MANRLLTIKKSLTGQRQIRLVEVEEAVTGAGAGLVITNGTVGHSNIAITAGTFAGGNIFNSSSGSTSGGSIVFKRQQYDAYGHSTSGVSDGDVLRIANGLCIYEGVLQHTNKITAGTLSHTVTANTLKYPNAVFDEEGHISSKGTDGTLTFTNGIVMSTGGAIGHANSITAGTFSALTVTNTSGTTVTGGTIVSRRHTYDAYGHVTSANTNDVTITLNRGLGMYANAIGHSNNITAGTAGLGSTTACITGLKWDAQGHITAVTTSTMYPPTTVGISGQFWKSNGAGQGVWGASGTLTTSTGLTFTAYSGVTITNKNYYIVETDWGYTYDIEILFASTLTTQSSEKAIISVSGMKGTAKNAYEALSPIYKSGLSPQNKAIGLFYGTAIYLDSVPVANIGGYLHFHFIRKK